MAGLSEARLKYQPVIPEKLKEIECLSTQAGNFSAKQEELKSFFPLTLGSPFLEFVKGSRKSVGPVRVGVVFSGGQAAGGHNVIWGVFNAIKRFDRESRLFGFLDGPSGIIEQKWKEIDEDLIQAYYNQGGFDLIGSGRTKIETPEQFVGAEKSVRELNLDGLIIIGGDDSNTNAAFLAEYFLKQNCKTCVIGVPKTIDGDLKNEEVEIPFGFDTATKTYSEIIGNICKDVLSAKKYTFFIKLMGRSASHIALECALQTQANLTFIGEEVEKEGYTLGRLVQEIADMICLRSKEGKDYGVILIPEGIIEFIPEFKQLIKELNALLLSGIEPNDQLSGIKKRLTQGSLSCFQSIPVGVQKQLLLDRDPHGNVKVSKIETERMLIEAVNEELSKRKIAHLYEGSFSAQPLFCGYEGRSSLPTNFDSNYCYSLGLVSALLVKERKSGYMASVKNLCASPKDWEIGGVPLTSMMHLEERKGKFKPVIQKALVDLRSASFLEFKKKREIWKLSDEYRYPGPIQFFGPSEITDEIPMTVKMDAFISTSERAN